MKQHGWHSKAKSLGAVVGAALLAACSIMGPIREEVPAKGYQLGKLPNEWKKLEQKDDETAEVFQHPKHGSVIASNSMCYRYENETLQTLTAQLLQPVGSREILKQEAITVDDREALETRVKGLVDGVPVEAVFVVVRKNRCLFDFSLNASPEVRPSDYETFKSFVGGFKYSRGQP